MTGSRLIHPRMMQTLERDFFLQRCTVQAGATSQGTTGQEKLTWATVSGCEAIPCRRASAGGGERRAANQIYLDATHTILLSGIYKNVNEKMRAVVDGQAYDILLVEFDGEEVMTRLTVRIVR